MLSFALCNLGKQLSYSCHNGSELCTFDSLEEVVAFAYKEPLSVTFTDEDKKCYSEQELDLLVEVIERECTRIKQGYETISLDLEVDVFDIICEESRKLGIPADEYIESLLKTMIEDYQSGKLDILGLV